MGYRYSLAFLTTAELSPPEAVHVAAEAGYDMVGLRLLPAGTDGPYPLLSDPTVLKQTQAALAETGVALADIEIIRITPDFDPQATLPFLERGAALGARNILTAGYDPDMARMSDSYGAFCDLAQAHGMTADLEFMPWTSIPDVRTAAAQMRAVNHPAAGVLVDALHVQRSDSPIDEIAALNPAWIHYAQLCDGPGNFDPAPEALIATARGKRLMPGDGDVDFTALLSALPRDIVLSVEVAQTARMGVVPALERAHEAIAKARAVVEAAGLPA
ncbi:sugar phosphate isomerase/epimerase [Pseudooceanicola sp. CBS1P-1]|uniref:TIM barrel protein n=1 Tax=Pseudooceanicola albus TaxID=2692189 RepID=A0A6L7G6B0_9RHOB|nr:MULTISPECIES: sugar phosphate isomerase/epimerase [Pseudooceanicola]MBT9385665.1 sugar phosphate isomerase/epimerase [Pseudooceanicola endophyticus]MXN18926.1 TIM barrel protein [Pseudooceanicola albus]